MSPLHFRHPPNIRRGNGKRNKKEKLIHDRLSHIFFLTSFIVKDIITLASHLHEKTTFIISCQYASIPSSHAFGAWFERKASVQVLEILKNVRRCGYCFSVFLFRWNKITGIGSCWSVFSVISEYFVDRENRPLSSSPDSDFSRINCQSYLQLSQSLAHELKPFELN